MPPGRGGTGHDPDSGKEKVSMRQERKSRNRRMEGRENPLLGFLGARPREVGESMRPNPRHTSSARARLSWRVGEKDFEVAARLIDIGRTGAALLVATPP